MATGNVTKAARRRLTPDDWAASAYRALARAGVEAIGVEPIAAELGATKGSFYWHFANRGALVDAALDEWERRIDQVIYVSATPGPYELQQTGGEFVEQVIRPTGLLDPVIEVVPARGQVPHLLEQIRQRAAVGERTLVTAGPDAPFVEFTADIMEDESVDVGPGGMIPINVRSRFWVHVLRGKGARIEFVFNGYPIRSLNITHDDFRYAVGETPGAAGVYRVRILTTPKERGYGPAEVLAMTGPIYARAYLLDEKQGDTDDGWVTLNNTWEDPSTVTVFDPSKLDPSQVITLDAPKK